MDRIHSTQGDGLLVLGQLLFQNSPGIAIAEPGHDSDGQKDGEQHGGEQ